MPKGIVWQTPSQAKEYLKNKRKEKEAGEEREGDEDDEDVDAEDGNGYGDGDGGDQGDRLTMQESVATNLEFTLHKSDIVWPKLLLQRIVSEVPHATRNKVSDFSKAQRAYLKPKNSSASAKCETTFWGVQYRTVPLNRFGTLRTTIWS